MIRWRILETALILAISPAIFLLQAAVVQAQHPTWGLQSWWTDEGKTPGPESHHLHLDIIDFPVGAGVPDYDGKISIPPLTGLVPLTVKVTVHHAPANSKLTTTAIYSEPVHKVVKTITWNKTLSGNVNEEFIWSGEIDTRLCVYDGRQEFRFLTKCNRPDGNSLRVTSGIQCYVQNGAVVKHERTTNWQEVRAWYNHLDYVNARFLSGIPRKPLNIIWSPKIELVPGSGGSPITEHWIVLDPANHFHVPGVMLKKGTGQYKGIFPIDCRTLAPGPHKLVLVTHAEDKSSSDPTERGTLSAVLSVPFEVGP